MKPTHRNAPGTPAARGNTRRGRPAQSKAEKLDQLALTSKIFTSAVASERRRSPSATLTEARIALETRYGVGSQNGETWRQHEAGRQAASWSRLKAIAEGEKLRGSTFRVSVKKQEIDIGLAMMENRDCLEWAEALKQDVRTLEERLNSLKNLQMMSFGAGDIPLPLQDAYALGLRLLRIAARTLDWYESPPYWVPAIDDLLAERQELDAIEPGGWESKEK